MTKPNESHFDKKPQAQIRFVVGQIVFFCCGIPFAAFGIFSLYDAWKNWMGPIRNPNHPPVPTAIIGLVFLAMGLGIMFRAITAGARKRKAGEKFLKQTDGGEKPWLSRVDWAAGKIKATSTSPIGFLLLWSFLALAMTAPAVHAIPTEWRKGNHLILVALLFPAIAFYLLGFSFVKWRSRRRFGDCFFEPAQIPAPLGGTLEGMIQTGARLRLENALHLKFSCVRRTVSGSGKDRSATENILWQDEKIFKPGALLPDPEPGHSGIPVFFKLPADQPECFAIGNDSVFWRLEAKSKMRGPDFSVAFDVPVFKVAGVIAGAADEPDPTASLQESVEEIRRDEHSKVQVSDGPNGREFYFPAARNPGMALVFTLFTLLFNGAAAVTFRLHAPVLSPIVLGLIGVLMVFGTFNLWFKSSRVTIDTTGARVTKRWLLPSRSRTFAAGDIGRFDTQAGMTSGSQVFYDLKLVTQGSEGGLAAARERFQQTGRRPPLKFSIGSPVGFTLASGIASKPEADWLAREMNKALGRK